MYKYSKPVSIRVPKTARFMKTYSSRIFLAVIQFKKKKSLVFVEDYRDRENY